MATFLIERTVPGAGQLTPEQLKEIASTGAALGDVTTLEDVTILARLSATAAEEE